MVDIRMDGPSGYCPVQAEGTINGSPAYFRARHNSWRLTIAVNGKDPVLPKEEDTLYERSEDYKPDEPFAAGYMSHEEALEIIERCAGEFDRGSKGDLDDKAAYEEKIRKRRELELEWLKKSMGPLSDDALL